MALVLDDLPFLRLADLPAKGSSLKIKVTDLICALIQLSGKSDLSGN